MDSVIWITGASSGIGAALAELAPEGARTIGVSRRPSAHGEHLGADLSDPASWELVRRELEAVLDAERPRQATFLHFAAGIAPVGSAATVNLDEYGPSVLLNSASGQVLGAAFLSACAKREIAATLVVCSGPGARFAREGIAAYCASKAAIEHWARGAALDVTNAPVPTRVFSIVPWGVDTAMVREAMDIPSEVLPLGDRFRAEAAENRLVSPESVAREIWDLVESGKVEQGAAIEVGAVPPASARELLLRRSHS